MEGRSLKENARKNYTKKMHMPFNFKQTITAKGAFSTLEWGMGIKNLFPFLFLMEWNQLFDSIPSVSISLRILHGMIVYFHFSDTVIIGIGM